MIHHRRANLRTFTLTVVVVMTLHTFFGIGRTKGLPRQLERMIESITMPDCRTSSSACHDVRLKSTYRIGILEAAAGNLTQYREALQSVLCYSMVQNYEFRFLNHSKYNSTCPQTDFYFKRHCAVTHYMKESSHLDYILFLDSDMGVVNPKRRIEEFLDENAEVIFYDRFYNWEVMAGSYLIKNSNWSRTFLQGFADYEFRLPKSFHGMDNGAIHAYLAEHALPHNHEIVPICMDIYNHSKGYDDLFLYEACIRTALGNSTLSGKIKILPKGTAWVRDNWMTNSKWNEERDFMIHNWKTTQLRTYSTLPIPLISNSTGEWYNPIAGLLDLALCTPGNTTWQYDVNLMATRQEIDDRLQKFAEDVERTRQKPDFLLNLYFNANS